MGIKNNTIDSFLGAGDPLAWIWEQLTNIYRVTGYPDNIRRFYEDREQEANKFERFLYDVFFEAYEHLLAESLKQRELDPQALFEGSEFVIISDAMSVREAVLFAEYLRLDGSYEVTEFGYKVAPFPLITDTLSEILLGKPSPAQGTDTSLFAYRYMPGPETKPPLPFSGNLLIWIRLPDKVLEEVTLAQTYTVEEAFQKTCDMLMDTLRRSGRSHALITSDHGYLYASKPEHFWDLPKGLAKVKNLFGKASRIERLDEKIDKIKVYEGAEPFRRRFVFAEGCAALRGRYWWGTASLNDRCAAHGGFSLLEALVPYMKVRKKDGIH